MATNTTRLIRDREKGGRGSGGGDICHYTVTARMTPALRDPVFLMFLINGEEQSLKTVSTNHNFSEEKGEPKRYSAVVLCLPA